MVKYGAVLSTQFLEVLVRMDDAIGIIIMTLGW
jgi:hypothetical protein